MRILIACLAALLIASTAVAQDSGPVVRDTFYAAGPAHIGLFGASRHFTAQSATAFEAGEQIVVESSVGRGDPFNAGKIGSFVAAVGHAGTAAVYAQNLLASVDPHVGDILVTGSEININNNNMPYGETSMTNTLGVGMLLNSAGPLRLSAALAILGMNAASQPVWNRGIALYGNSIKQVSIEDSTNAPTVLKVSGRHATGLDLANATGMATGLSLPNDSAIEARNAAGTGRIELIRATPADGVTVGANAASVTIATRVYASALVFLPNLPVYADNAHALAGGATPGQVYRTSSGQLMVAY